MSDNLKNKEVKKKYSLPANINPEEREGLLKQEAEYNAHRMLNEDSLCSGPVASLTSFNEFMNKISN